MTSEEDGTVSGNRSRINWNNGTHWIRTISITPPRPEPVVLSPDERHFYSIESKAVVGAVLDVQASGTRSGTNVALYGKTGNDNQEFRFVPAGDGFYFVETKLKSGLVLDIHNFGRADQTNISVVQKGPGTNAQKFKLFDAGNDFVRLVSAMEGNFYIGVADNNNNIVSRNHNVGDRTLFRLNKLEAIPDPNPIAERPFPPLLNPHPTADWMGANYDNLKNRRLNRVALPGTYNSATYDLTRYGVGDTFQDINPVVLGRIKNQWSSKNFNIIQVDYYNNTGIVNICKFLNGITVPRGLINSDAIVFRIGETNWGNWNKGVSGVPSKLSKGIKEFTAIVVSNNYLIPLGERYVLYWQQANGGFQLWRFDPTLTDPLPSPAVQSGTWNSIRTGHRLIPISDKYVLDWVPSTGNYNLWRFDPTLTDPLPSPAVQSGTWKTIRGR